MPMGKTFHEMTTPAEKLNYSVLSLSSWLLYENHEHNPETGEHDMDQDTSELMQMSKQLLRPGTQVR